MKSLEKSVFNLIEIFRSARRPQTKTAISAAHCEQKYHHDYYCDAERPFVEKY